VRHCFGDQGRLSVALLERARKDFMRAAPILNALDAHHTGEAYHTGEIRRPKSAMRSENCWPWTAMATDNWSRRKSPRRR
jgi:hypothetical protein